MGFIFIYGCWVSLRLMVAAFDYGLSRRLRVSLRSPPSAQVAAFGGSGRWGVAPAYQKLPPARALLAGAGLKSA